MIGEPSCPAPSSPLVQIAIQLVAPATPRRCHSRTVAARWSVAHADAATCATTAVRDTATFLAATLAADPSTLMLSHAKYGGGRCGAEEHQRRDCYGHSLYRLCRHAEGSRRPIAAFSTALGGKTSTTRVLGASR